MENQEPNPQSQANLPARLDNGQYAPGNSGNPGGNPAQKGFARWDVRVEQLTAKYPTCEDLAQFFSIDPKTGAVFPTQSLRVMNAIDAGILRHLFELWGGHQWLKAQKEFWDRKDGRPVETVHVHKHNALDDLPSEFDDTPEGQKAAQEAFEKMREFK